MNIKIFTLCAIIGVAISGLIIIGILSNPDESEISRLNNQNKISVSESSAVETSISKGTILLLLVVGVIGVIGVGRVGRKNKKSERYAQYEETHRATGDH